MTIIDYICAGWLVLTVVSLLIVRRLIRNAPHGVEVPGLGFVQTDDDWWLL